MPTTPPAPTNSNAATLRLFVYDDPFGVERPGTSAPTVILFDCVDSENWTFPTDVTEHPLEDGTPSVDHAVNRPASFDLRATVTQATFTEDVEKPDGSTPFSQFGTLAPPGDTDEVQAALDSGGRGDSTFLRERVTIEALKDARGKRVDIITTRHGLRTGYFITSINYEVTNEQAVTFRISGKEIAFATSEDILLPIARARKQKPPADDGTNSGTDPSAATRQKGRDLALNAYESLDDPRKLLQQAQKQIQDAMQTFGNLFGGPPAP